MITATANLEQDHVHILRLIAVIEKITGFTTPNVEHLEQIVEIIKNFADGIHHAKEETFLFPKMVSKGYSLQQGPISVMLHDHESGRQFVKAVVDSIKRYKEGDTNALILVYENLKGYGELLSAHISKENNVLFRMADNAFSVSDQQELLRAFEDVENTGVSGKLLKEYILAICNLEKYYS